MRLRLPPVVILASCAAILVSCAPTEQQIAQQQRAAQAEIEQCRAMGAVTHKDFMACQDLRYRQRAAVSQAQGAQLQAIGLALMTGAPQSTQNRPVCFKQGEALSGFNRICYYNCTGSIEARTIPSSQLCPLQ